MSNPNDFDYDEWAYGTTQPTPLAAKGTRHAECTIKKPAGREHLRRLREYLCTGCGGPLTERPRNTE